MVSLVAVYAPPLSHIHRVCLEEAAHTGYAWAHTHRVCLGRPGGGPPSEESTLMKLAAVLEMLSPLKEPVVVVGDLNAHTASLHPNVEGQLPRQSSDTTVNARGCALLALLE